MAPQRLSPLFATDPRVLRVVSSRLNLIRAFSIEAASRQDPKSKKVSRSRSKKAATK
jgi:hypothetical protein